MPGNYPLCENIKHFCYIKGVPIKELAEKCGFNRQSLARWKYNSPSFNTIQRISEFLGVSIDTLVTRKQTIPVSADEIGLLKMYKGLSIEEKGLIRMKMQSILLQKVKGIDANLGQKIL